MTIYSCDECRELRFALTAADNRAYFARMANDSVTLGAELGHVAEAATEYGHHVARVHILADAPNREEGNDAREAAIARVVASSAELSGGARVREERVDRGVASLTGRPAVPKPPENLAADDASPLRESAACPEPGIPPPGSGPSLAEIGGD